VWAFVIYLFMRHKIPWWAFIYETQNTLMSFYLRDIKYLDELLFMRQTIPNKLCPCMFFCTFCCFVCLIKYNLRNITRGASHYGLTIYIKTYLKAKNNYGNSNISQCKDIIFKKSSKRNQNPSRYYNSIINFKFQHKPKYHLSKILI